MSFRFVPPAGTPTALSDILSAAFDALSSDGSSQLLRPVADFLKVKHIFSASSGRAALYVTFLGLHRLRPDRDIVCIPAYTCYSVAAAVVRAGLKIRPVDVDPDTLDLDFSALNKALDERVLCVLTANMFGIPNNLERLMQVASAKNVFVMDDAAQALGAATNGHFSGTEADVGIYSLGRGKALPAWEGGLIATNSIEIAQSVSSEAAKLKPPSWIHSALMLCKMVAYSLLLHPNLYWIPNQITFLNLGATDFDPDFEMQGISPLSRSLLTRTIVAVSEFNALRSKNADLFACELAGDPRFHILKARTGVRASYVRLGVIAQTGGLRDAAVRALNSRGYGASAFYPTAVCDIPEIERYTSASGIHCPIAENTSKRLFTLPSHSYVKPGDIRTMSAILMGLKND